MADIKRNCDFCEQEYTADERNLKRGWGLTCSKSCAASMREKSKLNQNNMETNNTELRKLVVLTLVRNNVNVVNTKDEEAILDCARIYRGAIKSSMEIAVEFSSKQNAKLISENNRLIGTSSAQSVVIDEYKLEAIDNLKTIESQQLKIQKLLQNKLDVLGYMVDGKFYSESDFRGKTVSAFNEVRTLYTIKD